MNFMDALKNESTRNELVRTENGATMYKTTGKKLLDLNFSASSFRNRTDKQIIDCFMEAFSENPLYAMAWLFYCRDCREGMGERRFFRVVMRYLASKPQYAKMTVAVLELIPEYGRWDDMISLMDECCEDVAKAICGIISEQLAKDQSNLEEGKPVSLLAKWMPSDNTSSSQTRALARKLAKGLSMEIKDYRKVVVRLRSYLKVLEQTLSANQWEKVDYSRVPSQANLLYREAFLRHDRDRRTSYLESVRKGEQKINAETLFPHDIVNRYTEKSGLWSEAISKSEDPALEALWNALPNYVDGESGTLVVRDGSASMRYCIGDTSIQAIDVSTALAIYFAERCGGPFKDQFITFSNRPKVINVSGLSTLKEKLGRCYKETDCSNTDIGAVFDLILNTAVKNECSQADLPSTVLIVSDMEFDCATTLCGDEDKMAPLFDEIRTRFQQQGFQMPRLAFWNVCSRTNGIPIRENKNGVALVSGFSPATMKMVLQEETDPYLAMTNILNSERYAPVMEKLKAL